MERLIDPLLADIHHEATGSRRTGRAARLFVSFRGYVAFWEAVALYGVVTLARTMSVRWRSGRGTTRAGAIAATATFLFFTVLATVEPLRSVAPDKREPMLFLLLVPQALPLSVPLVLFVGVATGCRRRRVSGSIAAAVLGAALLGSVVSFGTINWVIPATNQTFREAVGGGPIPRGPGEWPPHAIRAEALAMASDGLARQAGSLLLEYHARWALVGTTLTFALCGLAVARLGGLGAALVTGAIPFCYMNYISMFTTTSSSIFSDESYAIAAAWAPNMLIVLASMAALADGISPSRRQRRDDTL
jgi:lipopolysaccharide export system permease LptF/LptG-like protein